MSSLKSLHVPQWNLQRLESYSWIITFLIPYTICNVWIRPNEDRENHVRCSGTFWLAKELKWKLFYWAVEFYHWTKWIKNEIKFDWRMAKTRGATTSWVSISLIQFADGIFVDWRVSIINRIITECSTQLKLTLKVLLIV
jgi:hypothetical protein